MGWVSRPPLVKGGQDFGVSATSLREAAPTTSLSTSQYKSVERCPPHNIG
ncbi:hypothetical protein [Nostoc sp.]